jgi:hypothetical protein
VVYENKEGFCCSSRRLTGHQGMSSTGGVAAKFQELGGRSTAMAQIIVDNNL